MKTIIQHFASLPGQAAHTYDPEKGRITLAYARTESGAVARLEEAGSSTASRYPKHEGTVTDVMLAEGWQPITIDVVDPQEQDAMWPTGWHLTWSRVWRYWITTPDTQLSGVQDFVAAAEAGGLPASWSETPAEDAGGTAYTLCSFRLTMDGARSLGAEQSALMALADLPSGVFFFQTVASIEGFTGVEKESRQPTTVDPQLYEPGTLFQTSHPDAAGHRGGAFGEADVMEVTGLSLT